MALINLVIGQFVHNSGNPAMTWRKTDTNANAKKNTLLAPILYRHGVKTERGGEGEGERFTLQFLSNSVRNNRDKVSEDGREGQEERCKRTNGPVR